ncbi:hypothetical protein H6P81_016580 [Aristolochia fimbriata]|uniref:DEUBAD domain-containing protein n=1 Tax=Aristolochia fimbriata TaxID=158543 RepID=A0AAV7EAT6_ARIFI|nr:hypothetical protein H6P81_016580 [Aristolochia fimbriata]
MDGEKASIRCGFWVVSNPSDVIVERKIIPQASIFPEESKISVGEGQILVCQSTPDEKLKLPQNVSHADINEFAEEESAYAADDDTDDDDSQSVELTGIGCEFCMVGDQVCSIPYELYSLPDLKDILSLETWNSCLTEEERFSLSAYLPDMDQHTYWLTMKELLTGKNMFFGSPLLEMFERLKSGFYPPIITQYREALKFLQSRSFCYSIKSYHENMAKTFSNMKSIWSQCQPNMSVEERIQIWNSWKKRKHLIGFNHKPFPIEQAPECKFGDNPNFPRDMDIPVSEHLTRGVNLPPISSRISVAPHKNTAKGVLKIKPVATSSSQTNMVCRPPPKGVLKIVPRGTFTHLASAEVLGMQTCRPSHLPQPNNRWEIDDNYYGTKLLPNHTIRNRKVHKSPDVPRTVTDLEQRECGNSTSGSDRNSAPVSGKSLLRYVRKAKKPKAGPTTDTRKCDNLARSSHITGKYAEENVGIRGGLCEDNPCQTIGLKNIEHYKSGATPLSTYPGTSASSVRMLMCGVEAQDLATGQSFNQVKESNRDGNRSTPERPPHDGSSASSRVRRVGSAPITYKRRKAVAKVKPVGELVKQPNVHTELESRGNLATNDRHPFENPKASKMKLKNWRDPKFTGNVS